MDINTITDALSGGETFSLQVQVNAWKREATLR